MNNKLTNHLKTNTPEYGVWSGMKARCYYEKSTEYKSHGGRGISVCSRWKNSFINFLNDMGQRPSNEYSLDRIDNDGNYEPSNCRWATRGQQCRNRRSNVWLTHNNQTKCMLDWSLEIGIERRTLAKRLKLGWSHEKIITTPLRRKSSG